MNNSDRFDLFSQNIYFLSKVKSLIEICKSDTKNKFVIYSLVEELENLISRYQTEINICPTCGSLVTSIPSLLLKEKITPVIESYITRVEDTTGVDLKSEFLPVDNLDPLPELPTRPKLSLPPNLVSIGESNKIKVIKGKLLSVGS